MDNIKKMTYDGCDFLELPATSASYLILKEWVSSTAMELAIERKAKNQILVVIDEIFTNISQYAYPEGVGSVKVEMSLNLTSQILEFKFTDQGIAYNPLDLPEPDIHAPIEEREIGGLGLFIVRKIMKTVEYERKDGCNILILSKEINPASISAS